MQEVRENIGNNAGGQGKQALMQMVDFSVHEKNVAVQTYQVIFGFEKVIEAIYPSML